MAVPRLRPDRTLQRHCSTATTVGETGTNGGLSWKDDTAAVTGALLHATIFDFRSEILDFRFQIVGPPSRRHNDPLHVIALRIEQRNRLARCAMKRAGLDDARASHALIGTY